MLFAVVGIFLSGIPLAQCIVLWIVSKSNEEIKTRRYSLAAARQQGGRVVRVLDFESVGPGFESHSEHFMDLFLGCPEL